MLYGSRTKYWSSSSGSYSPTPGYGSSDDTAYPDSDTQYRYFWADGTQLDSQVLHDKNGTSTVAYNYTNGGHILTVNNSATGTTLKSATYTTDGQGRILSREQNIPSGSTNAPSDLHFYFGGVRMGDVSDNGTANEAMGDTSPIAPKPAKKGCAVLGQILQTIVAVAVTAITAAVSHSVWSAG